jgi:uncharacterized coiled-coil protein SlyX
MSLIDKVKEPPIAISLTNSAILLLSAAYFNKRLSELEEKNIKLEQTVNSLIRNIVETKKKTSEQEEIIGLIKKKLNSLDKKMKNKDFDNLLEEVKEAITVLEEKGIKTKTRSRSKINQEESDFEVELKKD